MEPRDPLDMPAPQGMADPMLPRPFRVLRVIRDTSDVVTLHLSPQPGEDEVSEGLAFAPGQFNMLYVFGVGEVPISISGDPDNPCVLVHTIRDVGAVTRALCKVRRGDTIGVRGPFGTAWPVERAQGDDILFIAGGIGLAPLRPAFYHVLAHRRAYGRVILIYGARTPGDLLYRKELASWRGHFGLDVQVIVDTATSDWFGPVGVVTRLLAGARFDPADTTAMLCGPEVMMRFCTRDLTARGVPGEQIHVSLERNMKCAIGFCGHCQLMPHFLCKDGPVYRYSSVEWLLAMREV
jgi:NAD(P)H-flavin reductase